MTADHDTLTQTLTDTQHQLERAKTDSAQAQLADLRHTLDQQSKELNVDLSKLATFEATANSDKAEIARLQAELTATKGKLKTIIAERDKLSELND